MIPTILEAGAVLIVIAGIIGGFLGGFKGTKSTNTSDANETIQLINEARKALEEKITDQGKIIEAQEKRIADLEAVNASYVKLFQGDPSQLEKYMRDTALAMQAVADTQKTILGLIQAHQPATTVNITK